MTLTFPYYCLTEFLPNKSVQYYIDMAYKGQKEHFEDTEKFIIIVGIALGMRYLHSKNIVHRDLKPLNILLDSNYYPRVCDFGLSKMLSCSAAKTFVGTLQYCPPEVFNATKETEYDGKKADIYSFGMTIYSILYEENPFSEVTNEFGLFKVITQGGRPNLSDEFPSSINDLISRCWDQEPEKRPDFSMIVDEFLSGKIKISNEEVDENEINEFLKYCQVETFQPIQSSSNLNTVKNTNESKHKHIHKHIHKHRRERVQEYNNESEKENESKQEHKSAHENEQDIDGSQMKNKGDEYYHNQEYEKAIVCYKESAKKHNANALYQLGFIYHNGLNVEKDYNKALDYYLKSTVYGRNDAFYQIGCIYDNLIGITFNQEKPYNFFQTFSEGNIFNILYGMGFLYFNGYGVKQDYNKAMEYFLQSAEEGNIYAFRSLGYLYLYGYGVKQDYKKAMEYYVKSAEKGSNYALYNIVLLYEKGLGVKQDYSEAMKYYLQSAEKGNSYTLKNIGYYYEKGYGVKQDYNKAMEYYLKSAEKGNVFAINSIGYFYYKGYGVKQDYNKAMEYYLKTAEKGNEIAKKRFGKLKRY